MRIAGGGQIPELDLAAIRNCCESPRNGLRPGLKCVARSHGFSENETVFKSCGDGWPGREMDFQAVACKVFGPRFATTQVDVYRAEHGRPDNNCLTFMS